MIDLLATVGFALLLGILYLIIKKQWDDDDDNMTGGT